MSFKDKLIDECKLDYKTKQTNFDNINDFYKNKNNKDYEFLKRFYQRQRTFCNERNKTTMYNFDINELLLKWCGHWNCQPCRQKKKYVLFLEIIAYVYALDLNKHFIITSKGNEYRDNTTFVKSYRDMLDNWKLFKQAIQYKFGYFDYILLPRSQNDGFCHFHLITNKFLDWYWLNNTRKKYGLGYLSIQRNQNVADYLSNDYFKDAEYYIPPNIRHYITSRRILLNNYERNNNNLLFFEKNVTEHEVINQIRNRFGFTFDFKDHYMNEMIKKSICKDYKMVCV